jgi:hypothetical protein
MKYFRQQSIMCIGSTTFKLTQNILSLPCTITNSKLELPILSIQCMFASYNGSIFTATINTNSHIFEIATPLKCRDVNNTVVL